MKKILSLTASIILLGLISFSCKKAKETTAQKLQHKWTIVSEVDNSHDSGGDDINTSVGVAGDFLNFNADGTVTSQFEGSADTSTYSLISDTEISISGETFTIKTLSDTQLVLYIRDIISATDYDESTVNLKR
jgi:hypothetical protein